MGLRPPFKLTVECDGCGETKDFLTAEFCGGNFPHFGVDEDELEKEGWSVNGRETYCRECSK